jgi:oligopeptide/dipeptide ABC transporter ATP-binding protein
MSANGSTLLEVSGLKVELPTESGTVHAVNDIHFDLRPGEVLGLVGESGCGKSMTALSLMRLIPEGGRVTGSISFGGRDLLSLSQSAMRSIRGRDMAMVFQDPMSSLNPVMTVGQQLAEPLIHHLDMSREQARRRSIELLDLVGIPDARRRLDDHPFEFSGGMRQRVVIAMAIACNPRVLIADEPTTALDVTIQAQILELLRDLREQLGTAIILISHDLGVIAGIADRVAVMYAGQIVEASVAEELFDNPRHPYTMGLLQSVSRFDRPRTGHLTTIDGQPPDLIDPPKGCPFWARCSFRLDPRCEHEMPPLRETTPGHFVASFCEITR